MELALEIASWVLLLSGSFFCLVGGFGLISFPDFWTRVHAATVTDTLGACLLLAGLGLQAGLTQVTFKLFLVAFFLLTTSPIAAHALAKAAHGRGLKIDLPVPATASDPVPEEEGEPQ